MGSGGKGRKKSAIDSIMLPMEYDADHYFPVCTWRLQITLAVIPTEVT